MRKPRLKPTDVPPSILLMGINVPIILKKVDLAPDEEVNYGSFSAFENTITIDIHCPKALLHQILVHEIGHAILHLTGVSAMLEDRPALEEAVVRAFTSAFTPLIEPGRLRPDYTHLVDPA